jgi:hypothetical protein
LKPWLSFPNPPCYSMPFPRWNRSMFEKSYGRRGTVWRHLAKGNSHISFWILKECLCDDLKMCANLGTDMEVELYLPGRFACWNVLCWPYEGPPNYSTFNIHCIFRALNTASHLVW